MCQHEEIRIASTAMLNVEFAATVEKIVLLKFVFDSVSCSNIPLSIMLHVCKKISL